MWQLLWVNFNCGTEKVSMEAVRRNYHVRIEHDNQVGSIKHISDITDMDKDEVDESTRQRIVTNRVFYPFSLEKHACLDRRLISDFGSHPAAIGKFGDKAVIVFRISDIKQPNHVLRLLPEPKEREDFISVIQNNSTLNVLKEIGLSARDFENADIYHVKNAASMIEMMIKFHLGIPLADVTKLVRLENRVYTADELRAMGLGELKLSKHGTEIPIIEQLAPDEFIFYPQNYDDWKSEIDSLIIK